VHYAPDYCWALKRPQRLKTDALLTSLDMPSNARDNRPSGGQPVQPVFSRPVLRISYAVAIIVILLGMGAVVFHSLEGWNWLDSTYFAVSSLTTVGYGDFVPHHETTRLFLIFYLLVGVATLLYALSNLVRYYVEKRETGFENYMLRIKTVGEHASKHIRRVPHSESDYSRKD
jgi:hypothetical protein